MKYFLENRISAYMLCASIAVIGAISCDRLAVSLMPQAQSPGISVIVEYPGVSPDTVERIITRPVEKIVKMVEGIESIDSVSEEGKSRINITFTIDSDMRLSALKVRERISLIRRSFPREVQEPVVVRYDPSDRPVIIATVEKKGASPAEVREIAERTLKPMLRRIDGVSEIYVAGGMLREIHVDVNRDRFESREISFGTVASAVRDGNVSLPGGVLESGGTEYMVNTSSRFRSPSEIAGAALMTANRGSLVRLGDVASVGYSFREADEISRLNGAERITLYVHRSADSNALSVCSQAADVILKNPQLRGRILYNQGDYIRRAVRTVAEAGVWGVVIVIIVLALFIRKTVPVLAISLSIPFSLSAVFAMMYFGKIDINVMSLSGLALGAGMVVDNGIIIAESVFQNSAITDDTIHRSVLSVRSAIVASTLATVIVFLPVVFGNAETRRTYGDLAFTVSAALLASMFVSVVLIPVLLSAGVTGTTAFPEKRIPGIIADKLQMMYRYLFSIIFRHSCRHDVGVSRAVRTTEKAVPAQAGRSLVSVIPAQAKRSLVSVIPAQAGIHYGNDYSSTLILPAKTGKATPLPDGGSCYGKFDGFHKVDSAGQDGQMPSADRMTKKRAARLRGNDSAPRGDDGLLAKIAGTIDRGENNFLRFYERALDLSFRNRGRVILYTAGAAAVAVILSFFLKSEVVDPSAGREFYVYMEYPTGTTLKATDASVRKAEAVLRKMGIAETITTRVEKWRGTVAITFDEGIASLSEQRKIKGRIRDELNGLIRQDGGFAYISDANEIASRELDIHFLGDENGVLRNLARDAAGKIRQVPGIEECVLRFREGRPEYSLLVDRERASATGVTVSDIIEFFRSALYGPVITKFIDTDREIDVRVRYEKRHRDDIADVMNYTVRNGEGNAIPVSALVTLREKEAETRVWRRNGRRSVTITAGIGDLAYDEAAERIAEALGTVSFSPEYAFEMDRSLERMRKNRKAVTAAVLLAVLLVYMLLASQFESLDLPLVILTTVPMALIGVIVALFVTASTLNIAVYIGVITLTGIAVNNGILLVDALNAKYLDGAVTRVSLDGAIKEVCVSRVRPVIITKITTVLGMLPMLLSGGDGSNLWRPLAATVISGLAVSTALTLLVIPVISSYLFGYKLRHTQTEERHGSAFDPSHT